MYSVVPVRAAGGMSTYRRCMNRVRSAGAGDLASARIRPLARAREAAQNPRTRGVPA